MSLSDAILLGLTALFALVFVGLVGWVLWELGQMVLDVIFCHPRRVSAAAARIAAGRIRGRMKRMVRETLLLVPAREAGFSKLGGNPELPPGMAWPQGQQSFLAQIDLRTFRQHGGPDWLPSDGRLYAFCDETRYGRADLVTVLYSTEPAGPPVAPPARAPRFPERRVGFLVTPSIPSTDWLDVDLPSLDDQTLDQLAGIHDEPFGDELQHRIGGYPSEIQGGQMQVECEILRRGIVAGKREITPAIRRAAAQWRLLLQIDSDPALKMNWGDGGRLYVFIREQDARAGAFSKTVALSQTY